jgi:hypothetical protein
MAMLPVFFPVSRETVISDAFADDCVHNPAEFELFNFTYDSVEDAIKDRLLQLERAAEPRLPRCFAAPCQAARGPDRFGFRALPAKQR